MEHPELDLRALLGLLRRRLILIAALPLAAALVAGLVSQYLLTPIYQATTTMWIIPDSPAPLSYTDLMLSRNLTTTYAQVARSRAVAAAAIDRLGLQGMTVAELQAKLTVAQVRDTEIISITAADPSPAMATQLADAVAGAFMGEIHSFMRVENVVVVDPALKPAAPASPNKAMNVAMAFVLGLMAAVALAFLQEHMDTSVRTPEDVQRHVGLPALAAIPLFAPIQAPTGVRHGVQGWKRAVGEEG